MRRIEVAQRAQDDVERLGRYYRLDGDNVVRIMAVWGAIRGREPKL